MKYPRGSFVVFKKQTEGRCTNINPRNNPITSENVHSIAAELGVKVDESEVEVFSFLLAAAHDTFEELSALPDYHPETDTKTFPRRSVHPGIEDPSLGFPWSYRCDIKSQGPDSEDGSRAPPKTSLKLLSGQNVVVKDNICVAEIPQNNGTDAILPWIPQSDASVVRRILEAGGRIVGTATCEALSCATVSNTAAAGPIYNPLAKGYSAGGSSSGVAALVGRRQDSEEMADEALDIHMGLGADQGGSIRVPAAFCGLVGLKATHGLIPYTGVGNCEPTLDHVGPICRTVWDTALMLEAIAGSDDIDDRQVGAQRHGEIQYSSDLKAWYEKAIAKDCNRPLEGMRAGVIMEGSSAPFMKDEMKDELIRVVKQFEQLGAIVEDVSVPGHVTGRALWMAVCRQSLTSVALGNPAGRRGYYPVGLQERILPWNQEKWDKLPPGMRNEFINGIYEKNAFPTLYGKCMNMTTKCKLTPSLHISGRQVLTFYSNTRVRSAFQEL